MTWLARYSLGDRDVAIIRTGDSIRFGPWSAAWTAPPLLVRWLLIYKFHVTFSTFAFVGCEKSLFSYHVPYRDKVERFCSIIRKINTFGNGNTVQVRQRKYRFRFACVTFDTELTHMVSSNVVHKIVESDLTGLSGFWSSVAPSEIRIILEPLLELSDFF